MWKIELYLVLFINVYSVLLLLVQFYFHSKNVLLLSVQSKQSSKACPTLVSLPLVWLLCIATRALFNTTYLTMPLHYLKLIIGFCHFYSSSRWHMWSFVICSPVSSLALSPTFVQSNFILLLITYCGSPKNDVSLFFTFAQDCRSVSLNVFLHYFL